ncbi:MAG: restriction endonuclease subunit S [Paludibacteraceae bacterium]|nr:restriction endonuclease subunit S [Paludibacteraceae bacterium]
MTAQQLRNSILQQAIQGRLVPQAPNDEPASVLLERIRKEKEQLVKEGKLKKKDLVTTPIADDEKPFDIPSGWEWCRIGEISSSYIGLTYSPSDVSDGGMLVLRSSNIKEGKLNLCDQVRVKKDVPEKLLVNNNDILICARNGSKKLVGKSAIIKGINEPMTFGAFMAICKTPYYKYVYQFLQSDLFFSQLREVSGTTTINQLTQNNFNSFIIPLPPLAEQRRIVAKIEELMPLVEKYGKAQTELDTLNQDLPRRLRQSVLQQAIQGKLVEQDPNDEPASVLLESALAVKQRLIKEKKIKPDKLDTPISDDEFLFQIPNGWSWVRLNNVHIIARGGSPRPIKEYLTDTSDGINWIKIGDTEKGGKYINSTREKIKPSGVSKSRMIHKGDFLLTNSMSFGRPYISNVDGCIHDGWLVISPAFGVVFDPDYLYYLLSSPFAYDQFCGKVAGAVVQNLNSDKVATSVFPLPPLAEQRRIVAKIEELFAEIDKLK